VITGGLAPLFVGQSPLFDHYDPDLTLNGLHLIYRRVTSAPGAIDSPSVDRLQPHV
jgi:hypothetical protein